MTYKNIKRRLPAEWETQSAVQITWPDASTDWATTLDDALKCYCEIVRQVAQRQHLIIVSRDKETTRKQLGNQNMRNITIVEMPINDTWARDHGFVTVLEDERAVTLDFQFNGWGLKFAACYDNLINQNLYVQLFNSQAVKYESHLSTVLEGGSIESDGQGTILTTSECLLSANRNGADSKRMIEQMLMQSFGAERVMWLDHGYLAGDDTDSHVDTLARFAPNDTILYVKCDDRADEHFEQLGLMEQDLQRLRTSSGEPYTLVPLPMPSAKYFEGERLPATYANFLYINGAVLVPIYNVPEDEKALEIFRNTFTDREIVGIDCSALIVQHGSLHCVTMQFPEQCKL